MATTARRPSSQTEALSFAGISWSAIIAGALGASALAFVLHSFAVAIGLSVSSTSPTWRDASFALVLLSGLYIVLVALASYGFGAYVAARMQAPFANPGEDSEFRDGMHGLVVWALATLITALVGIATLQALPRLGAQSDSGGGVSDSVAGEAIVAYDLDRLFRSQGRSDQGQRELEYRRAEAARILLTTSSHDGLKDDDRSYLVRIVGSSTGLGQSEAESRVAAVTAQVKENISRARRVAMVMAFIIGATALLGAVTAWFASIAAGRHRDGSETLHLLWDWSRPMGR